MSFLKRLLTNKPYVVVANRIEGNLTLEEAKTSLYPIQAHNKDEAIRKVKSHETDIDKKYVLTAYDEDELALLGHIYLQKQQYEEAPSLTYPKQYFSILAQSNHQYFISDSYSNLLKELDTLPIEELRTLLINIYKQAFQCLRSLADIPMRVEASINDVSFYVAASWHFTNALHKVPAVLFDQKTESFEKKLMVRYISEFFVFIKSFNETVNTHMDGKYNLYHYLDCEIYQKYLDLL